ncbi:MAG: hypothetical protein FWF22_03765 [Treponema sp.]|nr:hypothetical protein [Treponema sp.]
MKKIILSLVIFMLAAGVVFSQETVNFQNNIALHATLLGVAFNYERCLNPYLSLLADTSLNIFPGTFTAAIKGRVYPFGKTFYLEMGAGFGITAGYMGAIGGILVRTMTLGFFGIEDKIWLKGLVLTPALGWKIDVGKPGGFTLPISLGIDFFAGYRELDIPVDFVPNIRIGVGYSF